MNQMILAFFEFLKNYGKQEKVDKHPETTEKKGDSTRRVLKFLLQQFDFRYNSLTGVTEYSSKGAAETPYLPIDERDMNGMIVDARLEGIHCWNSLVPTLVLSNKVKAYNPFHLYMQELPV